MNGGLDMTRRLLEATAIVALLAAAPLIGAHAQEPSPASGPMRLLPPSVTDRSDRIETEPLRPSRVRPAARSPFVRTDDTRLTAADRALSGPSIAVANADMSELFGASQDTKRQGRKSAPAFDAQFSIKPTFNSTKANDGAAPLPPASRRSALDALGERQDPPKATASPPTAKPDKAAVDAPAPAAGNAPPRLAENRRPAAATPPDTISLAVAAASLPDGVPRRHPRRAALAVTIAPAIVAEADGEAGQQVATAPDRPDETAATMPSGPPADASSIAPPEATPTPPASGDAPVSDEVAPPPSEMAAPSASQHVETSPGEAHGAPAEHNAPKPQPADADHSQRAAQDGHASAPSETGGHASAEPATDGHAPSASTSDGDAPSASTDNGHGPSEPAKAAHGAANHGDAETEPPAEIVAYDGPRPDRLVRMLSTLQDDIARGSVEAMTAQRILSRRLGETFLTVPPRIWAERANGNALAIYALSGGNPTIVRTIVNLETLEPPYDAAVAGALAFVEGRSKDAKRHFEKFRVQDLDHSVRGAVYLARAALEVADDPLEAQALLDRARVTGPGTLVEEAALRRTVLIAAERDDLDLFERMVSRYLRKFNTSVYAGNFRQRLAAALTRMSFIDEPEAFDQLAAMLEPMTVASRQELYLLLARAAIENGNRLAAEIAAQRVQETAVPDSLDHRRGRLYEAAAQIVDPTDFLAALTTLNTLRDEELPDDDRALLDAALRLSATVSDLPPPDRTDPAPPVALAALDNQAPPPAPSTTSATPIETAAAPADAAPPSDPIDTGPFANATAMEQRVAAALAEVDTLLENSP
ncbi:hypothetical protein L1787_03380 [Acuticoccus sp. M5D2P5]|uniref:hypothetical protein n=1 Tax=Acuticoccus kalidii TaxID=2910977 RepID=UPI001F3B8A96|nr:hypothetical protein [Acuticoccus kalidii]MCF3932456.1 hypothetical protein [Acuticoccus kalidii]